jgi:hypothetical protein
VSLDAPKSDAELLAMLAEKQGRVGYVRVVGTPPDPPTTITTSHKPGDPMVLVRGSDWPLSLRIPWSCLISDNALYLTRGKAEADSIQDAGVPPSRSRRTYTKRIHWALATDAPLPMLCEHSLCLR